MTYSAMTYGDKFDVKIRIIGDDGQTEKNGRNKMHRHRDLQSS